MLGHLSGQYGATLAPVLLTQLEAAKLWASFWVEHIFVGCGRPVILSFFFFFFLNAKPFIALGDVKSTRCLRQRHATQGLPTSSIRDTVEPGPRPWLSAHSPPLLHWPSGPEAGQRPAELLYFFLCLWFRGFNYQPGFLFTERAIVWCCAFIHP